VKLFFKRYLNAFFHIQNLTAAMRRLLLTLLICLPFSLFAQTPDSAAVAREVDSLLRVSLSFLNKEDFVNALNLNDLAQRVALEKLGSSSSSYGTCIHIRGLIYFNKGDYTESEDLYIKAAQIRGKAVGKEHSDYLGSIINLAVVYKTIGKYEKAESLFLEAKETYEVKKKNLTHSFYFNCLANLSDLYVAQGNYEKAELLKIQVIEIRKNTSGKEHPDYAKALTNAAVLYIKMGQYEKAETLLQESLVINEKALGKEHSEYAASLLPLGGVYTMLDNFEKAEPLLLKAKEIRLKVFGKDHSSYGYILNTLAGLYQKMGNNKKAEPLLSEVKTIWEKSLGKESPEYALSLNNLASVYTDPDDFEKAEQLLKESLSITEKVAGKESPSYATYLDNLASLYTKLWLDDKASLLYLESLSIQERILGKDHPDYATGLRNLAGLYLNMEKYTEAEPLYRVSRSILKKTLGSKNDKYASTLNEMAILYFRMGMYQEVDRLIQEVTEIERSTILGAMGHLSEMEMNMFLNKFSERQSRIFSMNQQIKNKGLVEAGINNTLFYKGLLGSSTSQTKQLSRSNPATANKFDLLVSYQRRLATEYALPIAERDSARVAEWEEKANTIEKELVRTVAGYGDLTRQIYWQEVQGKLQSGEAAVELVSYRYFTPEPTDSTMYAALVLLPTDTAPHFIPLFEERQLQALFNRPGFDEHLTVKGLYSSKSELLNLLWQPLEPLLRDVKTIYYSPAGLLHRINPAALLDESKQPLSANRQWVRVGSTRELVTGRLADRSFARTPEVQAPLTAMIYGGITYDMDSLAFAASNPMEATNSGDSLDFRRKDGNFRYIVEEQSPGTTPGIRGGDDGVWEPLTGSAREAEQVSAMLHNAGFRTDVRQGFDASEERIKKIGKNEPSPRILHLATHGFAYPDPKKEPPKAFADSEPAYKLQDDPMLRSGLVLAGANHYWKNKRPLTNREDGVLVAYEVRDLNLRNTELAVLSACQTGLGDVVGSEGVYGLQRAFRIAGAKFLIVSLWQVPDTQTQELMRLFYENWLDKKESLRDAFNHAQQTLREQEPNPYMWAGFVLIE